jgi:hypothetical protein
VLWKHNTDNILCGLERRNLEPGNFACVEWRPWSPFGVLTGISCEFIFSCWLRQIPFTTATESFSFNIRCLLRDLHQCVHRMEESVRFSCCASRCCCQLPEDMGLVACAKEAREDDVSCTNSIRECPNSCGCSTPCRQLLECSSLLGVTCSTLALSTVLRTTSLSYGNMPFSGTHRTKTPWPIVLKFCTVDYVGETTKPAKSGYNRMDRGGSPYRWNISIYTLLYFTLLYFTFFLFPYQAYRQDPWTDLHARYLKRRGLLQASAFWGSHRWKKKLRGNIPSPKFSKGILHANRKSRITLDR